MPSPPADAPSAPALRPPKQSRSRRTLERIVQASLAILEADGPDGLTVQAIVERARSSVGSFYARFDGKDDLLDYLAERMWTEATERWDEALAERAWEDRTLPELVDGAVALLAETARAQSVPLRSLQASGGSGRAAGRFRTHVRDGLAEVLLHRRDDIGHPDPDTAARVGLAAASALMDAPRDGILSGLGEHGLRREARRLLLGYLQVPHPGDDAPAEGVDFFDMWA